MTDQLDTEIEGEPANIREVSRWVGGDLAGGLDTMATEVGNHRRNVAGDWQGEAADGFAGRAQTLVRKADEGVTISHAVATVLDTLADELRDAKQDMAEVRSTARNGDLTVTGFVIVKPGPQPPSAGDLPADATPQESDSWHRRNDAVIAYNAQIDVWNSCVTLSDAAFQRWLDALEAAGRAWETHDSQYVGLTAQLLSAGTQLELVRRTNPIMVGQVDDMLLRAQQLRDHAAAMVRPDGRFVGDRAHYFDLLEQADRLDEAHPSARARLPNWEIPRGVTRAFWALDVLAAGYGIHSDWEEEGATQAIVSNAVPAVAAIAAGAASGAALGGVIGTFIPVPGVGTAAGVVVGAVVGTMVGAFTSGAVDSLFESGADTLGDWGNAVVDGFDEIGDTFGSIGEGVGDVFDSIF